MNIDFLEILLADSILFCFTLILLVPTVVLLIECVAALLPNKKLVENIADNNLKPTVTVLLAAHNEEAVIGGTINSIMPQLSKRDRLIVIADNCSDLTASIARNFQATVLERKSQQKGKGYALDYGLQSIQDDPSDVVIILDADCCIDDNYIESIARLAMVSGRPVQPINLLYRANRADLKSAISELAFVVKNLVRPKGLARLGFPCMVTMGTAFPWSVINKVPFASDNLVEDMQFGIDLAIAGDPPLFCADAKVTGVLPTKNRAATTQRTRWEHGHLSTVKTQVPRLIKEAWQQKRLDLIVIASDLSIPPLSFLVLLWGMVAMIGMALTLITGRLSLSVWGIMLEGLLLLVSIMLAWTKFGRRIIPFKSLASIPLYILWKIPIYFQFLIKPEKRWIRTERDALTTQFTAKPYAQKPQITELIYKK